MTQIEIKQLEKLELSLVGAILQEPEVMPIVIDILYPHDFLNQKLRHVYKACTDIFKRGSHPELSLVIVELQKDRLLDAAGGQYEVAVLTSSGAMFPGNAERHARLIKEQSFNRSATKAVSKLYAKFNEPGGDILEDIELCKKELEDLTSGIAPNTTLQINDLVKLAIDGIKESINGTSKRIPLQIPGLQRLFGGLKKKRLYVVAARPGEGKTVFGFGLGVFAAKNNHPVGILSQEMAGVELAERLLSSETQINAMKISNAVVNNDELKDLEKVSLAGVPLFIDDTPGLTLQQVRSRAQRMKREHNIELLIIDYLQLCESEEKESREQQISKISRGLKRIAKELDIPVIALSQLNRQSESRGDCKPRLSDLRDSGAIEQDADNVILLHRPEYHGQKTYQRPDNSIIPSDNLMVLIVAKNRGGITGEIDTRWIGSTLEIKNY